MIPLDGMNSFIDTSKPPYVNIDVVKVCHSMAASSANLSTVVYEDLFHDDGEIIYLLISLGDLFGTILRIIVFLFADNIEPEVSDL